MDNYTNYLIILLCVLFMYILFTSGYKYFFIEGMTNNAEHTNEITPIKNKIKTITY